MARIRTGAFNGSSIWMGANRRLRRPVWIQDITAGGHFRHDRYSLSRVTAGGYVL